MPEKQIPQTLELTFSLEAKQVEGKPRTVQAAISNETVVNSWFGKMKLSHDKKAIDMTRARKGLVMLFSHNREKPIGRVENIRLDDDKTLRGDFRFSEGADGEKYLNLVNEGVLTDVSVGAEIQKIEQSQDDPNLTVVTKWQPYEASIVSVGRIPSVGINQEHEVLTMPEHRPNADPNQSGGDPNQFLAERSAGRQVAGEQATAAERARQRDIRALFDKPRFDHESLHDLRDWCLENDCDLDQARELLLDHVGAMNDLGAAPPKRLANRHDPVPPLPRGRADDVVLLADERDKFIEAASDAIAVKYNLERDENKRAEARKGPFVGMSLLELGRESLRLVGIKPKTGRNELAAQLLTFSQGHSTSDFPSVLANIANKTVMVGFQDTTETWRAWCRIGNLTDFKQAKRVALGAFPDMDKIPENGEFKFANLSDVGEPIQLGMYGKKIRIGRQALINDDLNAFNNLGKAAGQSAARVPGDLAYGVLTGNPVLTQDSKEVFHADHKNLVDTGSGAAPSIATLNAGFVAMELQQDPDANVGALGVRPSFILVPAILRATAMKLIKSEYDPSEGATTSFRAANPYRDSIEIISDRRLGGVAATAWYLAANPNQADTVEVAFLDGMDQPNVVQSDQTPEGMEWHVWIDAAAAALGYTGLYKNAGA